MEAVAKPREKKKKAKPSTPPAQHREPRSGAAASAPARTPTAPLSRQKAQVEVSAPPSLSEPSAVIDTQCAGAVEDVSHTNTHTETHTPNTQTETHTDTHTLVTSTETQADAPSLVEDPAYIPGSTATRPLPPSLIPLPLPGTLANKPLPETSLFPPLPADAVEEEEVRAREDTHVASAPAALVPEASVSAGVSVSASTSASASAPQEQVYVPVTLTPPLVMPVIQERTPVTYREPRSMTLDELHTLYNIPQLKYRDKFLEQFFKGEKRSDHPLYVLLERFRVSLQNVTHTSEAIKTLKENIAVLTDNAWMTHRKVCTPAHVSCADGNRVTSSRPYEMAEFKPEIATDLRGKLHGLRDTFHNSLVKYSFVVQVSKMEVSSFIDRLLSRSDVWRVIGSNQEIDLLSSSARASPEQYRLAEELRQSIDVLFYFVRTCTSETQSFMFSLHAWLEQVLSAFLRIAGPFDHSFLLNHIIRCHRGGGKEFCKFVQFPDCSKWNDDVLNHVMYMLHTLLSPFKPFSPPEEALGRELSATADWTTLEEDGSSMPAREHFAFLSESDFILLLEQFPIASLLSYAFRMYRPSQAEATAFVGWGGVLPGVGHDQHSLPKLFAFVTVFMETLASIFTDQRRSLHKHLITHVARHITSALAVFGEYWVNFKSHHPSDEPREQNTLSRFQVEYDQLFKRTFLLIREASKFNVWQFMSALPFGTVSLPMAWRILSLLYTEGEVELGHTPEAEWGTLVLDLARRERFADMLERSADQSIHILATLSKLICSRNPQQSSDPVSETAFIRACFEEILYFCFLCTRTREANQRVGRDLLGEIVRVHPFLISVLIERLAAQFNAIGRVSMYIMGQLPLDFWEPSTLDIDILGSWLLKPLKSTEHALGRKIISDMHFSAKKPSGELFVTMAIQRKLAVLLVEAHSLFITQESSAGIPFLHQGHKQSFSDWCWDTLLSLRIHGVPFLALAETSWLLPVRKNFNTSSMSAFAALMMCEFGTDLQQFMHAGISLLELLVKMKRIEAALRVLFHVLPTFILSASEAVLREKRLQDLILSIIRAENIIGIPVRNSAKGNEILRRLSEVIVTQIRFAQPLGDLQDLDVSDTNTSLPVVSHHASLKMAEFWLRFLWSFPEWYHDSAVRTLIDGIFETAFDITDGHNMVQLLLNQEYDREYQNWQRKKPAGLLAVVNWMTGSEADYLTFSDEKPGTSSSECCWLIFESLWLDTIREDQIRNKAAEVLSLTPGVKLDDLARRVGYPNAGSFVIYRWARALLHVPMDHPLLPLFFQVFFSLFLAGREVIVSGRSVRRCYGHLFFAGSRRQMLEALERRVGAIVLHFREHSTREERPEEGQYSRDVSSRLLRFYSSLQLWLSDNRLRNNSDFNIDTLPPEYNIPHLSAVMYVIPCQQNVGLQTLWMDVAGPLIDAVRHQRRSAEAKQRDWLLLRKAVPRQPATRDSKKLEGLKRPLESSRAAPPNYHPTPLLPFVLDPASIRQSNDAINTVLGDLQLLSDCARDHETRLALHTALDCELLEGLPKLYINEPTREFRDVPCERKQAECAGPARIVFEFSQKRVVPAVQHRINRNRDEANGLLSGHLLPEGLSLSALRVKEATSELILAHKTTRPEDPMARFVADAASSLFYHIVEKCQIVLLQYPPTAELLTGIITSLGCTFISPSPLQTTRLLTSALEHPDWSETLAPLFQPEACPELFVEHYEQASQAVTKVQPQQVELFLRRFDVPLWLGLASTAIGAQHRFGAALFRCMRFCFDDPPRLVVVPRMQRVFEIHQKYMNLLGEFHYPDHFDTLLVGLLDTAEQKATTLECWKDFVQLAKKPRSSLRTMTYERTLHAVERLGEHFLRWRQEHGSLYPVWIPFLDPISELMQHLAQPLLSQATPLSTSYALLSSLFDPWLSALETGAEAGTFSDPWEPRREHMEAASQIALVFVGLLKQLQHPAQEAIVSVWEAYVARMCKASSHVLDILHHALMDLPWSSFLVQPPVLEETKRLLDQRGELAPFVAFVYAKANWTLALQTFAIDAPREISLPYHECLLHILLRLCCRQDVCETAPAYLEFLTSLSRFHWHLIDVAKYREACEYIHSMGLVAASDVFLLGSPTSYAMCLLRTVAEFPVNGRPSNILDVESYQLSKEKQISYIQFSAHVASGAAEKVSPAQEVGLFRSLLNDAVLVVNPPSLAVDELALSPVVSLLNCHPSMNAHVGALLEDLLRFLALERTAVLPVMMAACSSLASVDQMVLITEACASQHFYAAGGLYAGNAFGWADMMNALRVPDLLFEEFLVACVEKFCVLTLYTFLLQRLSQCRSLAEEERETDRLLGWLEKLDAKKVPEQAEKLYLLWDKAVSLLIRQHALGSSQTRISSGLKNVLSRCAAAAEDRESKGFLGTIGLGSKSPLSLRFRLASKALAAFLSAQFVDGGWLRADSSGSGAAGTKLRSKETEKMISNLQSIAKSKDYAQHQEAVVYIRDIVSDPAISLAQGESFSAQVAIRLFSDLLYMKVIMQS